MTTLTGDQMKHIGTMVKITDSFDLKSTVKDKVKRQLGKNI